MNKQLFDIFKACNFAEERRQGVSSVAKIYSEETYIFSDYFIDVVIGIKRVLFSILRALKAFSKHTIKKNSFDTRKCIKAFSFSGMKMFIFLFLVWRNQKVGG